MSGSLKEAFPELTNKAHLKINDKMLIEYVLAAVLECRFIERVFIVGDKDFLLKHISDERVTILPDKGNVYDNFIQAADAGGAEKMLLLTGDIPLIDIEALTSFLVNCTSGREIYYAIVPKYSIMSYDPTGKRTYAKIGKQVFTGGNVFMVNVAAVRRIRPAVERIFANRKNVFALLNMVGIGFVLKYLLGRVELKDIEHCAGRILESDVQAVICEHASIGIDVDKVQDFELVKRHLSQ